MTDLRSTATARDLLSWCEAGVLEWHARCRPSARLGCGCWCHDPAPVELTSFGFGHGQPPAAHLVVDVRDHFTDPHVSPRLRRLDGYDQAVASAVMSTAGIPDLIDSIVAAASAFRRGPQPGPVRIAIGCAGGRHRSVVIAMQVRDRLCADSSTGVGVRHRDIDRPVITRRSAGAR